VVRSLLRVMHPVEPFYLHRVAILSASLVYILHNYNNTIVVIIIHQYHIHNSRVGVLTPRVI